MNGFCTSDPIGSKLGSGGGTAWLLEACKQHIAPDKDLFGMAEGRKKEYCCMPADRVDVCPDMLRQVKY